MRHLSSIIHRNGIAVLLVAIVLGVACKKTGQHPRDYRTETTVYTTAQDEVLNAKAIYYSPTVPDGGISTAPAWYEIHVSLDDTENETANQWVRHDTLFTKKRFDPTKIIGMDVVVLTDYDAAHPKGTSISDLFRIETNGQPTMGLAEYFETYGSLAWENGKLFRLTTTTLPSPDHNYNDFFDIRHSTKKYGFGAVLSLILEDGTRIEIKPSFVSAVYYTPTSELLAKYTKR